MLIGMWPAPLEEQGFIFAKKKNIAVMKAGPYHPGHAPKENALGSSLAGAMR